MPGTGLALIALGADASRAPLLTVVGYRVTALTLHQGTFLIWAAVTGLHTLGRLVPALRIVNGQTGNPVPGGTKRGLLIVTATLAAVLASVLLLNISGSWLTADLHRRHPTRPAGR